MLYNFYRLIVLYWTILSYYAIHNWSSSLPYKRTEAQYFTCIFSHILKPCEWEIFFKSGWLNIYIYEFLCKQTNLLW